MQTVQTVVYQCLDCHGVATSTVPEPAQWQALQRQVPRLLCPLCGCGCAPQGWRLVAFEVCAQYQARGMNIDALAHSLWSGCPNSQECQAVGTYAGNCEQAQAVMPKCLTAVHSRLEYAEKRLDALAGTAPVHRPARQPNPALTIGRPEI